MNILFFLVATVMVFAALGVVLCKNPLHSALSLILTMIGVAILFAMLDAHFLSVVQLIVYAGAIMVLVLFVLMLLQSKEETYARGAMTSAALGLVAGVGFLYLLAPLLSSGFAELEASSLNPAHIGRADGSVEGIGAVLFTQYVFPFEIASLLIMVGLVGAVMVGSRSIHKRKGAQA